MSMPGNKSLLDRPSMQTAVTAYHVSSYGVACGMFLKLIVWT